MKALWAFEPFHQDQNRIKGMHKTLSHLTGSATKVEVGFIVTGNESSLNMAFDIPKEKRFDLYPREIIKQELKNAQIKIDDKKIHVVNFETLSNTKAVDRLLRLVKDREADVIGLFTHAKKGFLRFAIGSFAETAIHRSKTSLLIFNPQTKVAPKIKNILFASDFSPASKKFLKKVIAYSKRLNSHLTILHHAEVIYKWSLDEPNPEIQAYRRKVNRMKSWIEHECQSAGVSSEVIVVDDFASTPDHIFKIVKNKKIDLIVVGAKSGPLAALMGGSVTRQVVRESTKPVLVLK